MSTPAGKFSFFNSSTVFAVGSMMSSSSLWVRISNCSIDFLSTWGERFRELLDQCRQRNWAGHTRPGAFSSVHDLNGGLIQHAVIERLQSNSNALAIAHLASF